MVLGFVWYGPMFGKMWMKINGADASDVEARKKMQKAAGPLYVVQFLMTLFQVHVLQGVISLMHAAEPDFGSLFIAVFVCFGFVITTTAGTSMWTAEKGNIKWARFLIQAGYQLVLFVIFGLVLGAWR